MRKHFPKITATLFGLVFLMGGASTVFGADSYFFQWRENAGLVFGKAGPQQVSGPYADLGTCQTAQREKDSDSDFDVGFCHTNTSLAAEQASANTQTAQQTEQRNSNRDPGEDALFKKLNCGFISHDAHIEDCVPVITYYAIYKPASWLLIGSGFVFDAMITLSIDSSFINQDFVVSSWSVVRDFSNMLFIFILLYTGVQTILGIGNWRKTVLMVIVMALLINFSLFFTKVVIDAGNVLAVGIYNSMGTQKSAEFQSFQTPGSVPERDISASLAGAFHPERFLDAAGKVDALDTTIVFLIAAFISGYAGIIFFKAALLFIGRLVAFWFLMIVSPFAFISIALPAGANKFQSWLGELISQSFMAPVFLFLVYLIMKVLSAGNGILYTLIKPSGSDLGAFTFDKILAPVVIAAILMFALDQAFSFAKKMAGSFGHIGSSIGGAVMGVAGGFALGGTALLGRAVGGRIAQNLYDSGKFQKMATDKNNSALGRFAGRQALNLTDTARGASWDPRGTGLVKKVAKEAGIAGSIGKPSKEAEGGFKGAMKRQEQKDLEFTEKLNVGGAEKATIEKDVKQKTTAARNLINERTNALRTAETKVSEAEAALEVSSSSNGGVIDPGLSKILNIAKEEKERAEEALKKAEEAEKKIVSAEKEMEKIEKDRRKAYAKYVKGRSKLAKTGIYGATYSSQQARATAAKLRKGGKDAKPHDSGKELKELVKHLKEELDKEEKGGEH